MRISEQEKTARRKEIIERGLELVLQKGYNATGIQEIANVAGIPKGSFFNYFASKEEFAVELLKRYMEGLVSRHVPFLLDRSQPIPERLRNFFNDMSAQYQENGYTGGCLIGNLSAELADMVPQVRSELGLSIGKIEEAFKAIMLEAEQEGLLKTNLSPEKLANFISNSWEGAIFRMKIDKDDQALKNFQEVLFEFIFVS